jgi:hypothetical protein
LDGWCALIGAVACSILNTRTDREKEKATQPEHRGHFDARWLVRLNRRYWSILNTLADRKRKSHAAARTARPFEARTSSQHGQEPISGGVSRIVIDAWFRQVGFIASFVLH